MTFPAFLLSTDLILLILFDEYCSNVRFALEVRLLIENVTVVGRLKGYKKIIIADIPIIRI